MSIFNKPIATTNPSRNGFDLSKRFLFTAIPGQLSPIYHKYVVPGDHFKINVSSLTRTLPLKTDAYVRIREYVDFFFVPYRLLYKDFPDWVIQNSKAKDSSVSGTLVNFQQTLPYIDMYDTLRYDQAFDTTDDMGVNYYKGVLRLADLLGYGNFYDVQIDSNQQDTELPPSFFVNPFNACAYQKIYADFYRDSHWEDEDIVSWNLTPWSRSQSSYIDSSADVSPSFFKMRYANYKKDILMSIHPNKQFGSVSVVPLNGANFQLKSVTPPASAASNVSVYSSNSPLAGSIGWANAAQKFTLENTNLGISVLDIRMSEALQRWKEVTELNGFRYNEQVEAHFGFKVPDSRAQIAEFIDGWTNTVNISEIVNTAENQGNITGKGIGVNQSHEIEYTPKEHGVIMAIYHIAPDIDYNQSRVDFDNTMRDYEDFYIPEFQNLGLSDLQAYNFSYGKGVGSNHIFGYQLRYANMKSDMDTCHCGFSANAPTNDLKNWVSPLDAARIKHFIDNSQSSEDVDYRFFKVPPTCLDGLFGVASDGWITNDKFLCNFYFDVKAVRPISVDGMPY